MREITLEELLEAGCHFGHQVTRQNPKARDFVFEARDGIHIIDLAKTKEYLDDALLFVKTIAERPNASILIVGTKRQAQEIVATEVKNTREALTGAKKTNAEGVEHAVEANIFTVTNKWIGGTLTNLSTVQKNAQKLHDLTKLLGSEDAREKYTKKELVLFERERAKLESFYSGVADMKQLPDVLFVIDTHTEDLAVREANRMGIPVVGIVDTNADPDVVSNPIPANDDAVGSIEIITRAVLDAWKEGKSESPKQAGPKKAVEPKSSEEKKSDKDEKPTKKAKKK